MVGGMLSINSKKVMKKEKFDWGEHIISGNDIFLAGYDTHGSLEDAQRYCTKIAKAHYENFIISNWFTPTNIKQHIENIYAFCRFGDDLGDDAPFPPEERLLLLNEWENDLNRGFSKDNNGKFKGIPRHPIIKAIRHTASTFEIPIEPFLKLIKAFKMDQTKNEYNTWDELREYCVHSADPVGHLFLYVYGHDDEKLREISDYTCTALQLANHWQDISRDLEQNRIYMPIEDMEKHGYNLEMYKNKDVNENWTELMKFQVERAREWFAKGEELWQLVDPMLAVDLQMFTMGGVAILDSIEKLKFNTWKKRPKVSRFKQLWMLRRCRRLWKQAEKGQI